MFARNALTPELRGKIMQKPYLVSKNVSVTLHSPKQAPGQKSSRCIKRGGQTTTWSITTGIERARTGGTAPQKYSVFFCHKLSLKNSSHGPYISPTSPPTFIFMPL